MSTKKFYITASAVAKANQLNQDIDNLADDFDIDISEIIEKNLKRNPLNLSALVCKLVGEWHQGGHQLDEVTYDDLEGEFGDDQIKALETEEYLEHIQSDLDSLREEIKTEGLFSVICNEHWVDIINNILADQDDELNPDEVMTLRWAVTNREYLREVQKLTL